LIKLNVLAKFAVLGLEITVLTDLRSDLTVIEKNGDREEGKDRK